MKAAGIADLDKRWRCPFVFFGFDYILIICCIYKGSAQCCSNLQSEKQSVFVSLFMNIRVILFYMINAYLMIVSPH
jgi:hypothetical protein